MGLADEMRTAAGNLVAELSAGQRELACHPFGDDAKRRWLEYRPRSRPGACIAGFSIPARKAAHRLLATALSEPAYAQAMVIVALEETLDRREGWRRGRHSGDYWVNVFGDPAAGQPWAWRFEGHHLSVTMTLAGDRVSPGPVFFGANPHRVSYAGRTVSGPLAPEEDLARGLLDALGQRGRSRAIIADEAPADIVSGPRPRAAEGIEPRGVAAADLGPGARAVLGQLVALYLERLPGGLIQMPDELSPSGGTTPRASAANLYFAWSGPLIPGLRHYYRIQGEDLLIEYDNTTDDGNHAHTVLRRPRSDFGDDILAAHLRTDHA
jgi:Protein of unknown function (DUF3500)